MKTLRNRWAQSLSELAIGLALILWYLWCLLTVGHLSILGTFVVIPIS